MEESEEERLKGFMISEHVRQLEAYREIQASTSLKGTTLHGLVTEHLGARLRESKSRYGEDLWAHLKPKTPHESYSFEVVDFGNSTTLEPENDPIEDPSEDIAERINIRYGVKSINESIKFYKDKIKELEKQRDELQKSVKASYKKVAGERVTLDKLSYSDHMVGKNVYNIRNGKTGKISSTSAILNHYRIIYDGDTDALHVHNKNLQLLD